MIIKNLRDKQNVVLKNSFMLAKKIVIIFIINYYKYYKIKIFIIVI